MSAARTPTPYVDDVTSALRNDALEMDRRTARGERANGDAERLRATADYIDNLSRSHDALVAALADARMRFANLADACYALGLHRISAEAAAGRDAALKGAAK